MNNLIQRVRRQLDENHPVEAKHIEEVCGRCEKAIELLRWLLENGSFHISAIERAGRYGAADFEDFEQDVRRFLEVIDE